MRKLLSALCILFLCVSAITQVQAQKGTINIDLHYDENRYSAMQKEAGERGISPEEYGRWIAENGMVTVKADGTQMEGARITVLAVDENGSTVGEHGITGERGIVGENGSPVPLGRLVDSNELARAFTTAFPDTLFFPDSVFFPCSVFFPDGYFISSLEETNRMAADAGRRAIQRSEASGRALAFFIVITPGQDRFEANVHPGSATFPGSAGR